MTKSRWIMMNSNYSYWVTKGEYTRDEVHKFQCATPITPYTNHRSRVLLAKLKEISKQRNRHARTIR